MKKTTTKPDGTVETIEGTPEEITEYERLASGSGLKFPDGTTHTQADFKWHHQPNCDISIARRGWWSVNPPQCTCGTTLKPFDVVID